MVAWPCTTLDHLIADVATTLGRIPSVEIQASERKCRRTCGQRKGCDRTQSVSDGTPVVAGFHMSTEVDTWTTTRNHLAREKSQYKRKPVRTSRVSVIAELRGQPSELSSAALWVGTHSARR